jgi:hypothetical protein
MVKRAVKATKGPSRRRLPTPTEEQVKELARRYLELAENNPDRELSVFVVSKMFQEVTGEIIRPQHSLRFNLFVPMYKEGTTRSGSYKAGSALRKYFPNQPENVPTCQDLRQRIETERAEIQEKLDLLNQEREVLLEKLVLIDSTEKYLESLKP